MMVEDMKKAGIDPAIIYAYEKTGRLVTEQNQKLLSDADLDEWNAAIEEYEAKHKKPPEYPIGTVAFYGPDDKRTTKIAAGVIPGPTHQILSIFPRSLISTSEHAKDGGDLSRFMEVKFGTVSPSFPNQHSSILRVVARTPAATNTYQTPAAVFGGHRLVRHHRRSGRLGRDRAICS